MVRKVPIVAVIATLATTVAAIFAYKCYADKSLGTDDKETISKKASTKKEEALSSATSSINPKRGREEVIKVLSLVRNSQVESKRLLTKLTDDMVSVPKSFLNVYQFVHRNLPNDPLVECGMSVEAFDQILNEYQDDTEVKRLVDGILAVEAEGTRSNNAADLLDISVLIRIHAFMLEELIKIVEEYKTFPDRRSFNSRSLTVAAQALIGTSVKKQFKINPDQVEAGVLANYEKLQYIQEFNNHVMNMQAVMGEFMKNGEA